MRSSTAMMVAAMALGAGMMGLGPKRETFCPPRVKYPDPAWLNDSFLNAVRQVESGGNNDAVSPKGAVGPYQFMPETWKEQSKGLPFEMAKDEEVARTVCKKYYLWIYRTISGWQHSPAGWEQCAAAWNGGIGTLRKVRYDWYKMPSESTHFVYKVSCELKKNNGGK